MKGFRLILIVIATVGMFLCVVITERLNRPTHWQGVVGEEVTSERTWVHHNGVYMYPVDTVLNGDTLTIKYH